LKIRWEKKVSSDLKQDGRRNNQAWETPSNWWRIIMIFVIRGWLETFVLIMMPWPLARKMDILGIVFRHNHHWWLLPDPLSDFLKTLVCSVCSFSLSKVDRFYRRWSRSQ
jgi:hypothetical protein